MSKHVNDNMSWTQRPKVKVGRERAGILTCLRGWDEGDQSKGRGWCRAEGTSVKEPGETGGGGTRGWRGHNMARTDLGGYFEIIAVYVPI